MTVAALAETANLTNLYTAQEVALMENQNNADKDIDLINETPQKQESHLPIIALAFGLAPATLLLLLQIPLIGVIFAYLFFGTWLGIGFQIVGLILGIIALLNRKKHIGVKGSIFSFIAILSPFIWYGVLIYLKNYTSVEIFL